MIHAPAFAHSSTTHVPGYMYPGGVNIYPVWIKSKVDLSMLNCNILFCNIYIMVLFVLYAETIYILYNVYIYIEIKQSN
eukprot:SAG11_NODE_98_length_16927_cov_35.166211_12_plen_79_part_00